jgi:mRNA interferase MazF
MTTGESYMTFQRGDVVLVPFPFSNLSMTKTRPAVVVSSSLYHTEKPDLILVAITSNVAAATGPLDYVLSNWREAGLRCPSALKPALFTLDPAHVQFRVGALTPPDLARVDQQLRLALDL